jgi:hypothetical protein
MSGIPRLDHLDDLAIDTQPRPNSHGSRCASLSPQVVSVAVAQSAAALCAGSL